MKRHVPYWIYGTAIGVSPLIYKLIKFLVILYNQEKEVKELPFSAFLEDAQNGKIHEVIMSDDVFEVFLKATGNIVNVMKSDTMRTPAYRTRLVPFLDTQAVVTLLRDKRVKFGSVAPHWTRHTLNAALALLPVIYLGLMWKMMREAYNPPDSVGKNTNQGDGIPRVTFTEVAGIDEARAEVAEIVDVMKNGAKYAAVGARLPKGVLLTGPSGTGKTLLARAVACEAQVPFIACSASDFVEMLVGRGAARVRDLFQRGLNSSPCIIFIDEIDALAKVRGGINSNDEREQTLNQLLTEMDGFGTAETQIVVIAATNRPEVLDPALTRPGRFDRHVHVGLPNELGRMAILQVHLKNIVSDDNIDLKELAKLSDGCSGADLANIVNDSALLAVRYGHNCVTSTNLKEAIQRNLKIKNNGFLPFRSYDHSIL